MTRPADDGNLSPSRKSESKLKVLQDRIYQLEKEILERDQTSYERLDAIAKSSETLQSHFHKAIEEQAVLASALEQSQAKIRVLQQSLDLSDHQLNDLRAAHAEASSRMDILRAGLDNEMNEKMLLLDECDELRQRLTDAGVVAAVNSSLLLSISDLDRVIDQAESRCKALASSNPVVDVHQLQEMLSESELRISELSVSLDSERAYLGSVCDTKQQEVDALRVSLSTAQCDYGDLLEKYQALEFQLQEKSQLVQSLSAANQLLADDTRAIEDRLSERDATLRRLELELEESRILLSEHSALVDAHQQLLLANNELSNQVQSLADRERNLSQEILDLNVQVVSPQRDRLDRLEASNTELGSTIRELSGVAEENQKLKGEIELLRVDHSINQQALDQQLRLTEAQRQEAESRCHEVFTALAQAKLEHDTEISAMRQHHDELKHQLLSIRASLDLGVDNAEA
jgi:chromosome segregation ATPase